MQWGHNDQCFAGRYNDNSWPSRFVEVPRKPRVAHMGLVDMGSVGVGGLPPGLVALQPLRYCVLQEVVGRSPVVAAAYAGDVVVEPLVVVRVQHEG